MDRKTAFAFAAVVGIGSVGCHTAAWDEGAVHPVAVRRQPQYASTVVSDELTATNAVSLRDALVRTRPDFLRTTPSLAGSANEGASPSVYIDGRYAGSADVLSLMQVTQVREVRFLRPSPAHVAFGASCACAGGVIAVTTWAR